MAAFICWEATYFPVYSFFNQGVALQKYTRQVLFCSYTSTGVGLDHPTYYSLKIWLHFVFYVKLLWIYLLLEILLIIGKSYKNI